MTTRNVMLVLVGILIGYAASGGRRLYAQEHSSNGQAAAWPLSPSAAHPTGPRWWQFCEIATGYGIIAGIDRTNAQIAHRGTEGWELAAFDGHGIVCFKRTEPTVQAP